MTRIIAGVARGRRLSVPPGTGTRPTSDRAREGLFATITALHGPLTQAGVLDLYAGSGAIGLEALSRGAGRALFVESDPAAARVIRANMTAVGLPGGRLIAATVATALRRGPGGEPPFDVVVADPPYATSDDDISAMLLGLHKGGWLARSIASRSGPVHWPPGYSFDRSRRYGEATFWYGLAAGA